MLEKKRQTDRHNNSFDGGWQLEIRYWLFLLRKSIFVIF